MAAVAADVTASSSAFSAPQDAKLHRDVHLAVRVAIERFLDLVGTEEPALPDAVHEVFVGLGAAEAREHRGPEVLTAALRVAARSLVRRMATAMADAQPVDSGLLIDLTDAATGFVDALLEAATEGFGRQVRELAGEPERRRRHLADLVLRGGSPDGVVQTAAAAVGWPGLAGVVPVLVPPDQAREVRFRFAADGVVLDRATDAVLVLCAGPRTRRAQLAGALAGRGGVVGPEVDWTRAPEAVRLAELTRELTGELTGEIGETGGPARDGEQVQPVFAEDHLAALALRGEAGALAILTERRLAPLARMRQTEQSRLLVTLRSWLRHWGSRTAVARELVVHPQTVSYRVGRLREVFGDVLDDPTARFELLMVLESGHLRQALQPVERPADPVE